MDMMRLVGLFMYSQLGMDSFICVVPSALGVDVAI
jgi:hypothetical protein